MMWGVDFSAVGEFETILNPFKWGAVYGGFQLTQGKYVIVTIKGR